MTKHFQLMRVCSVIMLVAFLFTAVLPDLVLAQTAGCDYDKTNPTLKNARKNFLALNYPCAEEELNEYLTSTSLSTQERADAHVLLAEVYYAKVRNEGEKEDKVIEQFVAAFKSYRDWRGELNIKSPEFMGMMRRAQDMVDQGIEAPKTVKDEEQKASKDDKKKGPWYKKWWAIGLGVGVVAVAVVVLAGGGDEEDTTPALPGFPGTP
jgi:hypothetical protein